MPDRWSIVRVQDRFTVDPEGGPREVRVITWKTPDGYLGTLEMTKEEATTEAVKAAIEKEVKRLEDLYKLKG